MNKRPVNIAWGRHGFVFAATRMIFRSLTRGRYSRSGTTGPGSTVAVAPLVAPTMGTRLFSSTGLEMLDLSDARRLR